MLNIKLLSEIANSYMSNCETINKTVALENSLITINESIVGLENLKKHLKNNYENLSIANILSLCLSISEYTKSINETINYFESLKWLIW